MDSALGMIGLALKAGRLEAGEEAAGDACREKRCRLLLTAGDAGDSARRRAERFADLGRCLLLPLPVSKAELGAALGRGACAVAAVTDLGLARAIAGKLAAADPERYGEAAERLRVKAERAAQRREKTAAQRKQRQSGKPRTPAKRYRKG